MPGENDRRILNGLEDQYGQDGIGPVTQEERLLRRKRSKSLFYETAGRQVYDDYEYSKNRLNVLSYLEDNFSDGESIYESYQYAERVHLKDSLTSKYLSEMGLKSDNGRYYEIVNNTREYYQDTFDRHGRPVIAKLKSGSLTSNLGLNIIPANKEAGIKQPVASLSVNGVWKNLPGYNMDNFVITGYGMEQGVAAKSAASNLRYNYTVIEELMNTTKQARKLEKVKHIELSNRVIEAFGLQDHGSNEVSVPRFFSEVDKFIKTNGLSSARLNPADLAEGRDPLRAIESTLYKVFQDRGQNQAFKEVKKWTARTKDIREEQIGFARLFGIESEDIENERQGDVLDDLHKRLESNESALRRIEQGQKFTDKSEPTAMKKIIAAVNQDAFTAVEGDARAALDEQRKRVAIRRGLLSRSREDGQLTRPESQDTIEHNRMVRDINKRRAEEGKKPLKLSPGKRSIKSNAPLGYDETLESINASRAAQGLDPLAELRYYQIQPRGVDEERVDEWRRMQQRLSEEEGLFLRRQNDMVPYSIDGIESDGMITAKRLTMSPSSFDISLHFEDTLRVIEEVKQKSADHGTRDMVRTLTNSELADLSASRALFIQKGGLDSAANAVSREFRMVGSPQDIIGPLMSSRSQGLAQITGGSDGKNRINRQVLDIVASRAGWMFSAAESNSMLANNINLAILEAANEQSSMTLNPSPKKLFNQEFEDSFVKHLHRLHFSEGRQDNDAVDNLIRTVGDFARQYIPNTGDGKYEQRLAAEVSELLGPGTEAGKLIRNEFNYYQDAANPTRIKEALTEGRIINKASTEDLAYAIDGRDRMEVYDAGIDAGEADGYSKSRAPQLFSGADSERQLARLNRMNDDLAAVLENRDEIAIGNIYRNSKNPNSQELRGFARMRRLLGDEMVDGVLERVESGNRVVLSDLDIFTGYFNNLKKQHGDKAFDVMMELYNLKPESEGGVFNANIFRDMMDGMKVNAGVQSENSVRNIIALTDTLDSLKMKVRKGKEEFELSFGRNQEVLARSLSSNVTYLVSDSDETFTFSAASRRPGLSDIVNTVPAADGSFISAPSDALPLATNTPYNINRVNKSFDKYMSSSDVGTRQSLNEFRAGAAAVGYDFETTGLLTDKEAMRRGLVLPTEMFAQDVAWDNGMQYGNARHMVFNVAAHQVGDSTVGQMMGTRGEFGKLSATQLITDNLGERRLWNKLSVEEQRSIMGDYRIGFMRNLAKYSPELMNAEEGVRDLYTRFDERGRPAELVPFMKSLKQHARAGLKNLSGGLGVGAEVFDDLGSFMDAYNQTVGGKIQVLQNGADADVAWAKEWARVSGRNINEQPQIIESMHLSRILDPQEKQHSIEARVNRSGIPGLNAEYRSGSHLADVDTRAMLRLLEDDINRMGSDEIQWLRPGQQVAKVTSVGGNQIPHDLYTVETPSAADMRDGNSFVLNLRGTDGNVEEVRASTLQELQRNFSNNYKAFGSAEDAQQFLDDLTFDDAREDVSRAMLHQNRMAREYARANGGGLEAAQARYETLVDTNGPQIGDISQLSDRDQAIIGNQALFQNPNPDGEQSGRMTRAMEQTRPFFTSEDATERMRFLNDVEALKTTGVIDDAGGRSLVEQFNQSIKQRAAALGIQPQMHTVPGLVDLGQLGSNWGPLAGTRLTAMANTYSQAESSLWGIVNKMQPLVQARGEYSEDWKTDALRHTMRALKDNGIIEDFDPQAPRMADAVDAVMTRLNNVGPMSVENNLVPYIQGANADAMRTAYQEVRDLVLNPVESQLLDNPVAKDQYLRNRAVREELLQSGELAPGMKINLGSRIEGTRLPLSGRFAGRDVHSLMEEIRDENTSFDIRKANWREILNRATTGYSETDEAISPWGDSNAARGYLGWQSLDESGNWVANSSDQFIHPIGDNAGTKYIDLEDGKVRGMLQYAGDNQEHPVFQGKINQFLTDLKEKRISRPVAEEADDVARNAIRRQLAEEYISPDEFFEMGGGHQPTGAAKAFMENTAENTRSMMAGFAETLKNNKGAVGVVAAIATAGFIARQWTREDMLQPEKRPQHNSSPDGTGDHSGLKDSSPAYQGPAPSTSTYLTERGYNVSINARNPGGVDQDAIGGALQNGMAGRKSNINVHHQDDTTSINRDWLREQFASLI